MFNLILTIALQGMQPTFCDVVTAKETVRIACVCGVEAQDLKKRVCKVESIPNAVEIREVK